MILEFLETLDVVVSDVTRIFLLLYLLAFPYAGFGPTFPVPKAPKVLYALSMKVHECLVFWFLLYVGDEMLLSMASMVPTVLQMILSMAPTSSKQTMVLRMILSMVPMMFLMILPTVPKESLIPKEPIQLLVIEELPLTKKPIQLLATKVPKVSLMPKDSIQWLIPKVTK